ncbi:MAG: FecR family protein [Bacteroidota bacterium]
MKQDNPKHAALILRWLDQWLFPHKYEQEEEEYVAHDWDPKPFKRGFTMLGMRVAITAVAFTAIFFLFEEKFMAVVAASSPDRLAERAPEGQGKLVQLSDGTKVFLFGGSSISYPESFGAGNRHAYLDGSAYFEVGGNIDAPLIIHAKGAEIEANAAVFKMFESGDATEVEVSVHSGEIYFRADHGETPFRVAQHRRVTYQPRLHQYQEENLNWEANFSWREASP